MELLQDQGYYPEVMRLINSAQNSVRVCMFQAVVYPGHPESPSSETARLLKKAGVAVFFDSEHVTTHTKFLVIDNAIAVLGSTNWTYHALAKNHELSAVLYSPEAARSMNDYFEMVRRGGKRF
ncbi:MAG: phospholipase D-like domain-containing protein [Proteobacteria bacterium]|nr:phospholipase D-like domain-containing protein [Pseudomonadota bacterium]